MGPIAKTKVKDGHHDDLTFGKDDEDQQDVLLQPKESTKSVKDLG